MMGLTQGLLASVLFHFALMNPFGMLTTFFAVVFVAWGLLFFFRQKLSQLVTLFRCSYPYQ